MSGWDVHVTDGASPALRRFEATRTLVQFADSVGPRILAGLREYAPYRDEATDFSESTATKHRHLRDSLHQERHTTPGAVQLVYTSDVPQAAFTIEGTRPHVIEPAHPALRISENARTFLRWYDEAGVHFAARVNHPGTQPNPWPRHLIEYLAPSIVGELTRTIERNLTP